MLSDSAKTLHSRTLGSESGLAAGDVVLDIGCGVGRFIYKAQRPKKMTYRHLMILPTDHHMYDWYGPRLAEHFAPGQLRSWLGEIGPVVDDAAPPFHLEDYDDRARCGGHASFQFRALNQRATESTEA